MPHNVIEFFCHNNPTGRNPPMLLPKGSFFSTVC